MTKFSDETEKLRQQVHSLQNQIVELQRIASLGQLSCTTTHEFNNALMTIMNYAKMGIRNVDPAFREKSLNRILQASERAAKITQTVLGMARNRSDCFEPTQIADLIHESMFLLEKELQKYRVQVELEIDDVPKVQAIGNQIQQVLINLCTNARQAMANGGRLLIRLKRDPESKTVDLVIRDFGSGISTENLPRIFEPRFSTKTGPDASGKGGTGLGLFSCRQIIQAHGGKIRVESTVGRGTCFTIKFPETREVAPDLKTNSSPKAPTITGLANMQNLRVDAPHTFPKIHTAQQSDQPAPRQ